MGINKTTFASSGATTPAGLAETIVPADSDLTAFSRAVYVGGAGDLAVRMAQDSVDVVFKNVPAGSILPIRVEQIRSTLTTATDIVVLR